MRKCSWYVHGVETERTKLNRKVFAEKKCKELANFDSVSLGHEHAK
jgi:hypothetical protein